MPFGKTAGNEAAGRISCGPSTKLVGEITRARTARITKTDLRNLIQRGESSRNFRYRPIPRLTQDFRGSLGWYVLVVGHAPPPSERKILVAVCAPAPLLSCVLETARTHEPYTDRGPGRGSTFPGYKSPLATASILGLIFKARTAIYYSSATYLHIFDGSR